MQSQGSGTQQAAALNTEGANPCTHGSLGHDVIYKVMYGKDAKTSPCKTLVVMGVEVVE